MSKEKANSFEKKSFEKRETRRCGCGFECGRVGVGVDVGMGMDVKVFGARTHTHAHTLNSSSNVFRLMNYSDIVSKHKNRFLSST